MYDKNDTMHQHILVGKKAQDKNDDGPSSKKAQKNKWKKQKKNLREEAEIQEYQQSKPITKKQGLTKEQKEEIMVDDLKTYTSCSESLIRKKLLEANYNKELALNLIYEQLEKGNDDMMDLFDKKEEQKPPNSRNQNTFNQNQSQNRKTEPSKYPSNNKVEEEAYKLINDMYDKSEIQISGFEFEELFNEITQIIKEDQKEKGRGVIEINNFVQTCMTAKDAILVGLKDVFKVEAQIQFNQNDPVHIQLQNFIYEDTQKQVQQEVINKEEFPTLGESSKKKNNQTKNNTKHEPPKSSIVNQLQNEHRHTNGPIRKQDLFRPENYRPVMFTEKNSIFNVDNQQQSEDALRQLHKEYNHVSIQTLKIVYLTLDKNFHQSRAFLERFYPRDSTTVKKISVETNSPKKLVNQLKEKSSKRHILSGFRAERIEEIDRQLQRWTLSELRSEIQHLYNLRQVFHMTCKNINNSKQRQELMRIAEYFFANYRSDRAPPTLIRNLSKASRVKLIEETMRTNPNYVDLHGYREEEVSQILESMVASIRENFDRGNQRVKYKTIGSKTEAIVQIMTGKGRHSYYGKSILKPCVKRWCDMHDLRAIQNQDNVEICIPLV